MANALASLLSQASSLNLPALAAQAPIPPDLLRNYLRSNPVYNDNRERAAVVLDKGFSAYDTYTAVRPFLFWGSLATAAASGYALVKRRKKGSEAVTMWSVALAASLGVAWFTRPVAATTPTGAPVSSAPAGGVVAYLDAVRAKKNAEEPGWADRVFTRLANQPGVREQLDTQPLVKAAIV